MWTSSAFAVAGVAVSLWLCAHERAADDDTIEVLPWRWSPHQWEAFALLNVFVAAGVVLGFDGGATPR